MLKRMANELLGAWVVCSSITQSRLRLGHNIYDSEWDALIILDACRVDALREVEDEFDFIDVIEMKWSRGSTSKEWLENTFVEENVDEVSNTAYVTANSFARKLQNEELDRLSYILGSDSTLTKNDQLERLVKRDQLRADNFLCYDSLWDKMIGDIEHKEIHPEVVTDRAIEAGRTLDSDRLIVHYMQPHHPFIYPDELDDLHRNPFQYLDDPEGRDAVWDAYISNLRFVLEYVELLLNNLDADTVVITADHGELFGRYFRSHPVGLPHPKLRKVPWVTTTASDSKDHIPKKYELIDEIDKQEVKNRLSDLGYL